MSQDNSKIADVLKINPEDIRHKDMFVRVELDSDRPAADFVDGVKEVAQNHKKEVIAQRAEGDEIEYLVLTADGEENPVNLIAALLKKFQGEVHCYAMTGVIYQNLCESEQKAKEILVNREKYDVRKMDPDDVDEVDEFIRAEIAPEALHENDLVDVLKVTHGAGEKLIAFKSEGGFLQSVFVTEDKGKGCGSVGPVSGALYREFEDDIKCYAACGIDLQNACFDAQEDPVAPESGNDI